MYIHCDNNNNNGSDMDNLAKVENGIDVFFFSQFVGYV